jgi:hypothetical protein
MWDRTAERWQQELREEGREVDGLQSPGWIGRWLWTKTQAESFSSL